MTPKAKRTLIKTVNMTFIESNGNEPQLNVKTALTFDSLTLQEGGHILLPRSFFPLFLKEANDIVKGKKR